MTFSAWNDFGTRCFLAFFALIFRWQNISNKKVFLLWFLTFTIKDFKKFSKTLFPPKDRIFPKKSNSGNYKNVGTVIKSNPFFVQK